MITIASFDRIKKEQFEDNTHKLPVNKRLLQFDNL